MKVKTLAKQWLFSIPVYDIGTSHLSVSTFDSVKLLDFFVVLTEIKRPTDEWIAPQEIWSYWEITFHIHMQDKWWLMRINKVQNSLIKKLLTYVRSQV